MPGRLKTGQTPGKSGIVKLYCAGRCRGISRALSGFATGRRLKQHREPRCYSRCQCTGRAPVRFPVWGVGSTAKSHHDTLRWGISWALSGFAAGRRLNQHSETALCLLFPVRRSVTIRFCPVGVCSASISSGQSDPAPIRHKSCIEAAQYYSLLNIAAVYEKISPLHISRLAPWRGRCYFCSGLGARC